MATLARRTIKVLLFCALFLLAGRYVHTYPLPMTQQQQHYLILISEKVGVSDYELFYIVAMVVIDLIVALMGYIVIVRLWRRYRIARNSEGAASDARPISRGLQPRHCLERLHDVRRGDQKHRESVWIVLSEFFVDNEIDYDLEIARIDSYSLNHLKEIFFREVAPVCGPNLLTPIPPVWTGFEPAWLVAEISFNLAMRERSTVSRLSYEARVLYYRIRCADVWAEVEKAVRRRLTRHPDAE
jgi:hypothetical protein